jgi:ABC-type transporter Mla subunit MlaD
MMPGGGTPARSFVGLEGQAPKRLAVAIPYRVVFRQSAGGLRPGAPVTLRGFEVGEVTAVELEVDPRAADVRSRVDIALDPSRFHIEGGAPADGNWIPVMNDIVKSLVAHRWRARLAQSPPLVGSREVELAEVPDAPAATLQVSNGSAEIPATEGGGIEHLIQAAGQFPLREIGDNVRDITEHVKTLVASRRLQHSIAHIDSAVAQLDRTLHQAGPKVAPTIQSVHDTVDQLRQAAGELDSTIKDARALMGTDASAPDGSLEPTLRNVSDAARAVRVLADYLDEHPESLVRGRLR